MVAVITEHFSTVLVTQAQTWLEFWENAEADPERLVGGEEWGPLG